MLQQALAISSPTCLVINPIFLSVPRAIERNSYLFNSYFNAMPLFFYTGLLLPVEVNRNDDANRRS